MAAIHERRRLLWGRNGLKIILLALATYLYSGCEELALLQTHPLTYNQFSDFHYYQLQGTNKIALEFGFLNSFTSLYKVVFKAEQSGAQTIIHVYFTGYGGGATSKQFAFNTDHNAFTYIDLGSIDISHIHVVYDDEAGQHEIPYKGILDKPFTVEVPPPWLQPANGTAK